MFSDRLKKNFFTAIIGLILVLVFGDNIYAQSTVVKGRVTDKSTGQPLPYTSVFVPDTHEGTNTDDNGYYELRLNGSNTKLQVSAISYKEQVIKIQAGKEQTINIKMEASERTLKEIIVKPPKVKYRNKNNPAVDLIRQVIAHKDQNKNGSYSYLEYEQYEKLEVALSNTPEKMKKNRLFRSFKYIVDNIDTTVMPDKAILPLYLQEKITEVYNRKNPAKQKTIVVADKKVDFGSYIDNNGLNTYLKHMYQDFDIYDDNISVVTNQFLSPIATMAPTFYQFYIADTIEIDGQKLVGLSFFPRNKTDMLFQGRLYVTLDTNYAVQKVTMTINPHINLNWVRDLDIHLNFEKGSDSRYHLSKSETAVDFGISERQSGGIYGKRTLSFKNYVIDQPRSESFYKGDAAVIATDAGQKDITYWETKRHDTLTSAEAKTYANIDSLTHSKRFKRTMDIATLVIAGYKRATPYVEIGPVNTFYSFNPVEGFRLRLGGRTTTDFSKRYMFETYAAYGFKDQQWKYYFGGTYSFTERSIFEFPVRSLQANYQRDTKIPGQELQFVQEDNVLLSIKRGVNDKWLYNSIFNLAYLHEMRNHFSFRVAYKNWRQEPAGSLQYIKMDAETGTSYPVPDVTTSEASLELRWAPNEEFYQGKLFRTPMPNKYPIITLRGIAGIKGLLGGQYNYQNVTANIYKRVYLSQFGYSDVVLEGGNIFGQVPFPLLALHRANQTYSMQLQSYNMMNFLEFVSDHYASLIIDHCFNGFIFNKIPIVKRARLREFINLKMLYGGVRDENNPAKTDGLLAFPTFANSGLPATNTLEQQPYIEGSLGIGNIFNFFRVDVVKRFTYLNHPEIAKIGIRVRFKFDF